MGNNVRMLLSKDSTIRLLEWFGIFFFYAFDYDEKNREEEKWEWGEVTQSSEEKEWILAENFKITPAL